MVPTIFAKFGKMTHFRRLYPVDRKNSEIPKFKMADDRHFVWPLIRHNSATVARVAVKFGTMTHFDLKAIDNQNFKLLKI